MGIVENDVGALAAEFELDTLEISGGSLDDFLSGKRGACECDFVNAGMLRQILTSDLSITRYDVYDTRRYAHFCNQVRDPQCSERRQFRRLQHHRVACRERRTQLPAR